MSAPCRQFTARNADAICARCRRTELAHRTNVYGLPNHWREWSVDTLTVTLRQAVASGYDDIADLLTDELDNRTGLTVDEFVSKYTVTP